MFLNKINQEKGGAIMMNILCVLPLLLLLPVIYFIAENYSCHHVKINLCTKDGSGRMALYTYPFLLPA